MLKKLVIQYYVLNIERNKYHIALNLIEAFKNRANEFLSASPFDPNDEDIILLQNQVKTMISGLEEIEKSLR